MPNASSSCGNSFKATQEMDKIWEEKGLTDETMDTWLNEHLREFPGRFK